MPWQGGASYCVPQAYIRPHTGRAACSKRHKTHKGLNIFPSPSALSSERVVQSGLFNLYLLLQSGCFEGTVAEISGKGVILKSSLYHRPHGRQVFSCRIFKLEKPLEELSTTVSELVKGCWCKHLTDMSRGSHVGTRRMGLE